MKIPSILQASSILILLFGLSACQSAPSTSSGEAFASFNVLFKS